jgi:type I restriction enzyme S subunit
VSRGQRASESPAAPGLQWPRKRLKWTTRSLKNGVWGDDADGGALDITCIRVADFDRRTCRLSLDEPTIRRVTQSERRGRELKRGDLLLEKSGGGEKQPVGAVVIFDLDRPAVCSNFIARIAVAPGNDPRFLTYLHQHLYRAGVNTKSIRQSTGIQNLDSSAYLDEVVAVPPLEVQQAISRYLDRRTAAIDAAIQQEQRLLGLLEERQAALIHKAVTKGLTSDAPVRDSGIPWIGSVPSHWRVGELRRVWTVRDCKHRTPVYVDEGFPLVSTTEVKPGRLDLSSCTRFVSEVDLRDMTENRRPVRGDIIYSRNASLGAAAYVETDERFAMGQDVVLISGRGRDARYLSHFLNSVAGMTQVDRTCIGSTFKRINVEEIRRLAVCAPPPSEEAQIADQVDALSLEFTSMRRLTEAQVARLREYRDALVAASVTGQLKVPAEEAA